MWVPVSWCLPVRLFSASTTKRFGTRRSANYLLSCAPSWRARSLAMSTCLNPEPAPELSSLLWIAAGVGGTCLVLQAALTLLFAKLLPAGPWTSQPAFAACAQP